MTILDDARAAGAEVRERGEMQTRVCRVCGRAKALGDVNFRESSRYPGTFTHTCRACNSAKQSARMNTPDGKAAMAAYRVTHRQEAVEHNKRWRATHREAINTTQRAKRAAERERYLARATVSRAVRSGKLQPEPCFMCGKSPAIAHHPDYSRALDVVWLCPQHHADVHREADDAAIRSQTGSL